jgi:FHS family L-fucose permease-like MFS transporter
MWWGIANNMTDPLVKVFKEIFGQLSTFQSSLIQFAFYGGYFCLAIPGAIIARKFSYKAGVLTGLGMYAAGCFLLYPASLTQTFVSFLIAFWVLASGLSILETNANPYVYSLGSEATGTQRLNLAQSFNPVGSVIGILLCRNLIMQKLEPYRDNGMIPEALQDKALSIVIFPYLTVACILVAVGLMILATKMPHGSEPDKKVHFVSTFKRLFKNPNYVFAVIAQFFYVGVQITVWTYTNFYIPEELGVSQAVALKYHTVALILFGVSRFIATWLMTYIKDHRLLLSASILAGMLTLNVVFVRGHIGVYSLIGISACMSLMFPTIFGLGSRGLGPDRKIGGSGLIMAILGGALITPLQGKIIDISSVQVSYLVPLVCFIVVGAYAVFSGRVKLSHPAAQ